MHVSPKHTPEAARKRAERKKNKPKEVKPYRVDIVFQSGDKRHVATFKGFKSAADAWRRTLSRASLADQVRLTSRNTGLHVQRRGRIGH